MSRDCVLMLFERAEMLFVDRTLGTSAFAYIRVQGTGCRSVHFEHSK